MSKVITVHRERSVKKSLVMLKEGCYKQVLYLFPIMKAFSHFIRVASLYSGPAILGLALAPLHGAEDFSALKAHWHFDEGRDWHNMPYPYAGSVGKAADSVGRNDLTINDKLDHVRAWVSGRQFSGIRFDAPGQFLKAATNLDMLKGPASLSCWIKTDAKGDGKSGLIGDVNGIQWGVLQPDGTLAVVVNGTAAAATSRPVNDGQWHHVVMLRHAADGQVAIYMDGEASGKGKGVAGPIEGVYEGFGSIKDAGGFTGVLDQVHLFDRAVNADTIAALYDNHAPKAYELDTLISRQKPSLTGSILHLYTFDPDQDTLRVSRFGQGKSGTVQYNNDGTFTYTASPSFAGRDRFAVTLTDGRGGFCSTWMTVGDESTVPKMAVTSFTNYKELPAVTGGGERTGGRIPRAYDWDGDGRPDLLVCANERIWVMRNSGTRSDLKFDPPAMVADASGNPIIATSIALLPGKKGQRPVLVARAKDGTLDLYVNASPVRGASRFEASGKIANDKGGHFVCSSEAFDLGDFDNDGLIDLLVGSGSGGIFFHKNTGTVTGMKLNEENECVISGSYNLSPYFADLNGDGKIDLLHGINWGSIHYWINRGGSSIMDGAKQDDLRLTDRTGKMPMKGENTVLRAMNGTHGAFADFNGDGVLDMAIGAYSEGTLGVALGVHVNAAGRNLAELERMYKGHNRDLGKVLEANDQELLKKYRALSSEWISWAVNLPTAEDRRKAANMLKAHINRFDFLKRRQLDAWVKREDGKDPEYGPMHHVPGIFVMNWVTLHCMLPDSAAHRLDVADTLGLKGLDREQYLKSGVALADNNKCTDGQLLAITDMMKYHPRVLFPDDHLSIDQNMGDGREAMAYVFKSNKNTFGNDVGGPACESAEDLKEAAERYLGDGAATGDYFTFVMAHEVCHSLDAYVYGRVNQDLSKRWSEMLVYAANNAGENEIIVPGENGWMDMEKTRERFIDKKLWDGSSPWEEAWNDYWDNCEYKDLTFMRGNIGWFMGAKQESLATQANHHWAGSEARLVGAIDRYNRGYKANLTEVLLFLDIVSAGLNKIPMYHFEMTQNPNRVEFKVDKAWLERNDRGHVTKVTIGPRVYDFDVDERGKVTGIKSHPFMKEMASAPGTGE